MRRIEPFDVTIGHRIRIARVAKGISQSKLGNALGVTFQQVQKYENGSNRVGAARLHKIAAALDTSVTELFKEAESKRRDNHETLADLIDTAQLMRMMTLLKRTNTKQRHALAQFLMTLNGE